MSTEKVIRYYPNDDIVVVWQPDKCIHSRLCFQHLPSVFNPTQRPWVNIQGANTAQIKAQIDTCPSGALSYQMKQAESEVAPVNPAPTVAAVSVQVMPNGPLLVQGMHVLKGKDGVETVKDKVALCRCGASANKPYCDGSHRNINFQDA